MWTMGCRGKSGSWKITVKLLQPSRRETMVAQPGEHWKWREVDTRGICCGDTVDKIHWWGWHGACREERNQERLPDFLLEEQLDGTANIWNGGPWWKNRFGRERPRAALTTRTSYNDGMLFTCNVQRYLPAMSRGKRGKKQRRRVWYHRNQRGGSERSSITKTKKYSL